MERYYKKLMNNQKTTFAAFVDAFFLLLGIAVITFGICYIKLESMLSSCIITFDIVMIMLLLLGKLQDYKIKSFKRRLDDRIRQKLVLEKIVFGGKEINIKGYTKEENGFYISDKGKRARLLIAYPSKVLTPFEIAPFIRCGVDEIIASCSFDDDCRLLCGRKGIALYDKEFLLKNTDAVIDDNQIAQEIKAEVMEITNIQEKRKSSAFGKNRWSKYLATCLLLFAVSSFMGRYRLIYIAFGGMCMSFCFLSLFLSKAK